MAILETLYKAMGPRNERERLWGRSDYGKFEVILMDPPWHYNSRSPHADTKFGGGVHGYYGIMPDHEMLALGLYIEKVAAPNAVVFVWCVNPKLQLGLDLIETSGFDLKTKAFCWVKITKQGTPHPGPGYYTCSNTEDVYLGTRGKPPAPEAKMQQQVIIHPRMEHSRKPDEIHLTIDRMYPHARKLELFARRQWNDPMWVCLGNEMTGNDIRDDLELASMGAYDREEWYQ